jgi:hypothetical protein
MTGENEREDKLLGGMLSYVMRGKETVSFQQLSKDLNFMERTTSWRNSWKKLLNDKKFIEIAEGTSVFTGECRLTQAGKDHAATPEYEEYMKELNFVPQTNEEHQARIKKGLKTDKAIAIFELLLKHAPLKRTELSKILHCNDRQHKFSYGLKDLKEKGIAESAGKGMGYRLSDKAFLTPEDRPDTVIVDPKVFEEGEKVIESKKRSSPEKSKPKDEENEPNGARTKKKQRKDVKSELVCDCYDGKEF